MENSVNNFIKDVLIDLCQDKIELLDAYELIVKHLERQHPSGGLVSLDEEEVKNVILKYCNELGITFKIRECGTAGASMGMAKAICQRFGQPKINSKKVDSSSWDEGDAQSD